MKPMVQFIYSADVDCLETFSPEERDNFGFHICAIVAPEGKKGGESVQMIVCTPKWIKAKYESDGILSGKDFLIVFKYDYDLIEKKIKELLESCEGKDWKECGQKMARYGF